MPLWLTKEVFNLTRYIKISFIVLCYDNTRKEGIALYEWNEAVQKMIDWIEANITDSPSLLEMSAQIGYSPYYCSVQFHKICGMTIKNYVAGRRLALAAIELRDTNERIIDIAVKYGFSSQEALTRAFRGLFGCTPAAYRRKPIPVPLPVYKVVFFPEHYKAMYKGEMTMNNTILTEANVRIEYIPAHKYIGIWDNDADCYHQFWQKHDCDEICGIIDSLSNVSDPIVTGHTAGWYLNEKGERRYFYGTGVMSNYDGVIPDSFELREIPASYYLVFYHPPFDFMKDNCEVMGRVENLAWNYDIEKECGGKYVWNEEACQCYQRHFPEGIGYEVLRPIKLK